MTTPTEREKFKEIAEQRLPKKEPTGSGAGTAISASEVITEDGLAEHFAELYEKDLRYVPKWGRWLRFSGVWSEDSVLKVFHRSRQINREASTQEEQKATVRWLRSAATAAAVERMARCDPRLVMTPEQFDVNPWLFNTPLGTIDLRNAGTLREHRRADYITKIAAIGPGGDCPLWRAFLARVSNGDEELQHYLQRVAGYCLTGETSEHTLFFLYGLGANGKTTFTNTLLGIWSAYAQVAAIETFTENKNERHPTDLAAMRGTRLVVCSETEAGKRWAESRIKSLTGGDPIRARFMRCDEFEYTPNFKLLIQGNHRPGLRSVDEAIRRRFHLIPFTVTIPPEERDRDLSAKLKSEWPGILRWAVDGCLAWQSEGLAPPAVVRDATEKYLLSEDAVSRWLEDCAIVSPQSGTTGSSRLYENYKVWAERVREQVLSQKAFSQSLEERGFTVRRTHGRSVFDGIAIREGAGGADAPI